MTPFLLSLALMLSDPAAFEKLPFKERMAVVAPWFRPRPGAMVTASAHDIANLPANAGPASQRLKGFIRVTPPTGQCLRIIKGIRGDELLVCKPRSLSFRLSDLDQSGRLRWQVFAGQMMASLPLTWPSPYRFAQIIELGMLGKKLGHYEPIANCRLSEDGPWRRVTVDFLDGRTLNMAFHDDDVQLGKLRLGNERMANQGNVPGNMVHERRAGQALDGEHLANDRANTGHSSSSRPGAKPGSEANGNTGGKRGGRRPEYEGKSLGAIINSHMGKGRIIRQYGWVLQHRTAREMNGSRVYLEKIHGDTNGKCRYVFSGSPLNREDGMVECSYANDFDAILVPLACTSSLPEPIAKPPQPRLDPES